MSKLRSSDRVILRLRRIIPARREAVFQAWTNPELLMKWWSGPGCSVNINARVGGEYRWSRKLPDGTSTGVFGEYIELDPPKKLVFTFNWEDDSGPSTRATVEFHEVDGQTEIVLTHDLTLNANACEDGWGECLSRLIGLFSEKISS